MSPVGESVAVIEPLEAKEIPNLQDIEEIKIVTNANETRLFISIGIFFIYWKVIFSCVLRDSTPRFIRPSVGRSVGTE